ILQNADAPAFLFGSAAQTINHTRMFIMRAVGKVQAGNIHTQAHQVPQSRFRVTGRPNSADNLGFAGRAEFGPRLWALGRGQWLVPFFSLLSASGDFGYHWAFISAPSRTITETI